MRDKAAFEQLPIAGEKDAPLCRGARRQVVILGPRRVGGIEAQQSEQPGQAPQVHIQDEARIARGTGRTRVAAPRSNASNMG